MKVGDEISSVNPLSLLFKVFSQEPSKHLLILRNFTGFSLSKNSLLN